MGSLMAGWDSPRTSKKVFERNLSLTKEEIQHYWKNKLAENNCSTSAPVVDTTIKAAVQKSKTFSVTGNGPDQHRACFMIPQKELLKSKTYNGRETVAEVVTPGSAPSDWWTKTDWAFLNEAPVLEPSVEGARSSSRYMSQHNVTRKMKMAEI